MNRRLFATVGAVALLAVACGDDPPEPTPTQAEAIATLIDADLSTDEQRCMLEGLIDSGIAPESVVDGSLSGDDDALLLTVAFECVDDLSTIPAFVQGFIDAAAAEGTELTEEEARCVIARGDADPTTAFTECLSITDDSGEPAADREIELLADLCRNGNNQACDTLYETAPEGSDEFDLGRSCAGQLPDSPGGRCYLDLDA